MSKSRLITVVALSLMALQAWGADKSLVLYMPFDEGAGTTAKDVSTYSNPGAVVGAAVWVPGVKGTALEFTGNGAHVTIPEIPQYDVTAELSVMAWVKATTVPNWCRVVDKSQYQTSGFDLVLTQNVGLPRLEFFVNNTSSIVDGTTAVANGEWHFIAATFGGKTLRMYVDGKREGQTGSAGSVDINPNNWPLMIGAEASSNGGQQFFGSIDEVAMYNRALSVDEVTAIFQKGMVMPDLAADPQPKDKAVDVPRDAVLNWTPGGLAAAHDVYLGTSREDVNNAGRANPTNVLASQGQLDTTYDPTGLLSYGQTYFWRIDEVNAAPDNTIFKGDVWTFTAEPFVYPVTPIAAKASGSGNNMGPQNTINSSGLNANDEHSVEATKMWMSNTVKPAWIQYEFDKAYKLDEMWVWNSNQDMEAMVGWGAKDVTIEYSADGQAWKILAGVPEFAQATGLPDYKANTIVDFGGVEAKFVKLTINANWGSVLPQTGLSEVRFFYVPVQAFAPQPAAGATGVSVDPTLNWRPGREAGSHHVFFGSDQAAVAGGTATSKTVAEHSYVPGSLNLGTTYYWKVDEVNTVTYPGDVWSFATQDYVSVDDFEGYTNESPRRLFQAWIDGVGFSKDEFFPQANPGNGTGAVVGYDPVTGPIVETKLVHGGKQAMPLAYDNPGAGKVSEADRTFDTPQDWTEHGITTLVLFFRGQVGNAPASLYVKINGTKVPFGNSAATAMPVWKQWSIALASTGANLKSVKTLTIGVEGAGAGTVIIDDIRLYAVAPQAAASADPGTANLMALYAMDGNAQDSSGHNNHGTINGTASFEPGYAGQALVMNGTNTFVDLPIGTLVSTLTDTTVATHVNFGGGRGNWQRVFDFGSGTSAYMMFCPRTGTAGNMIVVIRKPPTIEQIVDGPSTLGLGWHHVAVTIDTVAKATTIYIDGERVASGGTAVLPKDMGKTTQNWIGKSQWPDDLFLGSVDDFRIYNRALSPAEVRYLAGDR